MRASPSSRSFSLVLDLNQAMPVASMVPTTYAQSCARMVPSGVQEKFWQLASQSSPSANSTTAGGSAGAAEEVAGEADMVRG